MNRRIILASQSRQRKIMLETLGFDFEIVPSDFNEQSVMDTNLKRRAEVIALKKAELVAADNQKSVVMAADTYGDLNGRPLEKPRNPTEAKQMLRDQSGKWVTGYTGFAYLDFKNGIRINKVAEFHFLFRNLSEFAINHYVDNNPVHEWSASFCPAYPEGMALIKEVKGSLTAFSHGLPIEWVVEGLEKSNINH